jgi:L-alanine-DL-glutamate epimerase-like enolase superfamily enzyme
MIAPLTGITARAYTIPTDRPEADGTLDWDRTTIVIAFAEAGGKKGMGYSYASRAATAIIEDVFADLLKDKDAFDIPACWHAMRRAARNLGVTGQVASAIAAVDTALWDLKARLLDIPLTSLMGAVHNRVPVYGSGGFTTYDEKDIAGQIEDWKARGMESAKIKIGAHPEQDAARVRAARRAMGGGAVYADANGAYSVKQALNFAALFAECGVSWFEEPVTSDNLSGLALIRDKAPPGMDIAAGEYGYTPFDARRMLDAEAVDVLQIDATRLQGYSGFFHAASLALAANIPVSSHCAPALHLPACCAVPNLKPMEYFHDHVRIESMIFDGVPAVKGGCLAPRAAPGHGLTLKEKDAERYAA